jgi:hypothetical protein
MKFNKWVEREQGDQSRTAFLKDFSKKCKVSLQTLQFVVKGGKISFYHRAQAISEATNDEVSIPELCE